MSLAPNFFFIALSMHSNRYFRLLSALFSPVRVISIVDMFLFLFSPSLVGISSVPMLIRLTLSCFINLCLTISAASTAVFIARPLAFSVTSFAFDQVKPVMIPRTYLIGGFLPTNITSDSLDITSSSSSVMVIVKYVTLLSRI